MRLRVGGLLAVISIVILIASPVIRPVGDGASAGIPDEQRVEVLIRNYDFEIIHRTPVTLGGEAVIILRNQDIVRAWLYLACSASTVSPGRGEG